MDKELPDLVVFGLYEEYEDNGLLERDRFVISVSVANIGNASCDDPWNINIYYNDRLIKSKTEHHPFKIDEIYFLNFTYDNPQEVHSYSFKVVIDEDDLIDEMNEDNNEFSTSIDIDGPDEAPSIFPLLLIPSIIILLLIISFIIRMRKRRIEN